MSPLIMLRVPDRVEWRLLYLRQMFLRVVGIPVHVYVLKDPDDEDSARRLAKTILPAVPRVGELILAFEMAFTVVEVCHDAHWPSPVEVTVMARDQEELLKAWGELIQPSWTERQHPQLREGS